MTEQSAYDRWMDQTADREQARIDRVHGAEGIIPSPLWLVLFVISGVIFLYMLFFADRAEGAVTQGMLMGSVTVVITLLLFLLVFFDHPHGDGVGRLQPTAMERTLRLIDTQLEVAGITVTPPCDEHGDHADGRPDERPELAGAGGHRALVAAALGDVVEQLPGHALERRAGRGRGARPTRSGSRRPAHRGWRRPRPRSTSPRSSPGPTRTSAATQDLAEFYVERFRDEFRPAFDAWLATDPLTNTDAPPTPFAMQEYQIASRDEAEQLDAEAEASAAGVRRDIQRSSNYVLTVVLYAVVLFFAGMSTRMQPRLRWVLTLAGCLVFVGAVAWIATFPVSLEIEPTRRLLRGGVA